MKRVKKNLHGKQILYIIVPLILISISLRFITFHFKSEGFSGMGILLPLLAAGILIFGLLSSALFSAWVYEDCKKRQDDPVLWALIVFLASPYIGLLIYFMRRPEFKKSCPSCGYKISLKANYCESCGIHIEQKEVPIMEKRTHHLKYIVSGLVSIVLMLICLTGFIVSAASGDHINTSVSSDKKAWNTGVITMSVETQFGNKWSLRFKSASYGFIKEDRMKIEQPEKETLYADIKCGSVPEGSSLTLWLVQGETKKSIDVTNLSGPLEYPLDEFQKGKIRIRLQINGVEDVESVISIK